jgi:hypothetical protein
MKALLTGIAAARASNQQQHFDWAIERRGLGVSL